MKAVWNRKQLELDQPNLSTLLRKDSDQGGISNNDSSTPQQTAGKTGISSYHIYFVFVNLNCEEKMSTSKATISLCIQFMWVYKTPNSNTFQQKVWKMNQLHINRFKLTFTLILKSLKKFPSLNIQKCRVTVNGKQKNHLNERQLREKKIILTFLLVHR